MGVYKASVCLLGWSKQQTKNYFDEQVDKCELGGNRPRGWVWWCVGMGGGGRGVVDSIYLPGHVLSPVRACHYCDLVTGILLLSFMLLLVDGMLLQESHTVSRAS